MRVRIGTSGYSYKEWKGRFYPEKLPTTKMLAFYASRFDTVEINATFYRMPQPGVLGGWARDLGAQVDFAFAFKAPVYLGLLGRGEAGLSAPAAQFFERTREVGDKLGPIYVQLPPTAKKDVAGLQALLGLVPANVRLAVEPGTEGWLSDDVLELLRRHGVALVASDDEKRPTPLVRTADFGYVRLRRTRYTKRELERQVAALFAQGWRDAWVFFKHEDRATGPRLATTFQRVVAARV